MMDVKEQKNTIISEVDLNHLILSGVKLTNCVLGLGSYGIVYKVEYNGTEFAAKQLQVDLRLGRNFTVCRRLAVKSNFLLECLQHSKLRHPNIVKMLGVYYPKKQTIPLLVTELMDCNLTQLLERTHNIIMYVKLSILQDVSRGLCYLCTQNPPIVHQALYSDNILLTKDLTAKIADFKTGAETVSEQALLSVRWNRKTNDFLPNLHGVLKYDLPLNIFSFGCIVCHVITQIWPSIPHSSRPFHCNAELWIGRNDSEDSLASDYWFVKKHQHFINVISDVSLKHLVEACLQHNSKNRPKISEVHERITNIMTG